MIYRINLLLRLVIAHFLADFLLQTKKTINSRREKKWKSKWLYIHALIYSLLLYISSSVWNQAFLVIPVIFTSHLLIHGSEARLGDNLKKYLLDQLSHLLVVIVIWIIISLESISLIKYLIQKVWNSPNILLIILGYLIILWPFGYFIDNLLEPFRKHFKNQDNRGLEKAGF